MSRLFSILTCLCLVAAPAMAQTAADEAGPSDMADTSHFRVIDYSDGEVVKLSGCINFQTMIVLGPDEHVQNVGIGNSAAWQVTPNKRGNLLFVKPLTTDGFSNMTVVSDKHSYNFELRNAGTADCASGRVLYSLSFNYAPEKTAETAPSAPVDPNAFLPVPEKRNNAYTYSGAAELVPMRVFDDGNVTYMRWAAGTSTPAVYALNSDNSESIVNYAQRGDYFVVEQVAPAFVLRRADMKVVLYNDAYRVEGLDAMSPKPRTKGGQ